MYIYMYMYYIYIYIDGIIECVLMIECVLLNSTLIVYAWHQACALVSYWILLGLTGSYWILLGLPFLSVSYWACHFFLFRYR